MSDLCDLNCADCAENCAEEQQYIIIEDNKNRFIAAVASEDNMVAQSLDKCAVYITFEIKEKHIISEGIVFASDAEQHGGLAEYLCKLGVKAVICNSADKTTENLLKENDIHVYTNFRGSTKFAIKTFVNNYL